MNTRPKIICHMMSSIDGRLLVDRWTEPAAGIEISVLRNHYDQVASRFNAGGWIVGRKSMEYFATGTARPPTSSEPIPREKFIAERGSRDIAVAIDPHGKLHYGRNNAGGDHIVAVLAECVSDAYLAELRADGVSYVFAGPKGDDLHQALHVIGETFAVQTLLLEGGGIINGAFLKQGLIDEISVLIYPGIDGLAGVPSIFEFVGGADDKPAEGRTLRHLGTETLNGGMVWLRYAVETRS